MAGKKPKLVLGNSIDGSMPIRGKMRMFRYGDRWLSSYSYDTLDLTKLGGSQESKRITVDEVKRFFDRAGKGDSVPPVTTDPRMTTGAIVFATMEEDGEYTGQYFRRSATDDMVEGIEDGYRTWGAQGAEQESVGLMFRLRQLDHGSDAYFDNARFQVSNILWEFSPDGGRSRWYQLYELPNKPRCRITLPMQTNTLRLRAVSNNPEEWLQSLAVKPITDYQYRSVPDSAWSGSIEIDDFGYMTWPERTGGYGDTVYVVYVDWYDDDGYRNVEVARTRSTALAPEEYGYADIIAMLEASQDVDSTTVSIRAMNPSSVVLAKTATISISTPE